MLSIMSLLVALLNLLPDFLRGIRSLRVLRRRLRGGRGAGLGLGAANPINPYYSDVSDDEEGGGEDMLDDEFAPRGFSPEKAPWKAHINARLLSIGMLNAVYMSLLFVGLGNAPGPISCLIPQIVPTLVYTFDYVCNVNARDDADGRGFPRNRGSPTPDTFISHAMIVFGCIAAALASAGSRSADESSIQFSLVKRDILLLLLAACSAAGSQLLRTRTLAHERLDIKKFHTITVLSQDYPGYHDEIQQNRLPFPNFISGFMDLTSGGGKEAPHMLAFGSYLIAAWGGYAALGSLLGGGEQGVPR
eukprot:jgi/Bigna1/81407/fgenesh1_pg.80_\